MSRMGSFAFRASQFFESIGKKTGKRLPSVSSMTNLKERTSTTSSLASPCTPLTPVFLPELPSVPTARPISHQGKLYTCM